jgi:hypothetical protein
VTSIKKTPAVAGALINGLPERKAGCHCGSEMLPVVRRQHQTSRPPNRQPTDSLVGSCFSLSLNVFLAVDLR